MAVMGRSVGVLAAMAVPGVLLTACGGGGSAATPPPETLSNTILVHVSVNGRPAPKQPVLLTRLGPKGEAVSSVETSAHELHMSRGHFEVALRGTPTPTGPDVAKKVTVGKNQVVTISLKAGHAPPRHSRAPRHRAASHKRSR